MEILLLNLWVPLQVYLNFPITAYLCLSTVFNMLLAGSKVWLDNVTQIYIFTVSRQSTPVPGS